LEIAKLNKGLNHKIKSHAIELNAKKIRRTVILLWQRSFGQKIKNNHP